MLPLLQKYFDQSSTKHSLCLLAHEDQVDVLCQVQDVEIYWLKGARPVGWRRVVWEGKNLRRIAAEFHADVVFTPYQIGARIRGRRQILMIRNMEPFYFRDYAYDKKSWLRNMVLSWHSSRALRKADRVIAVSELTESFLTRDLCVSSSRIQQIYHGRDSAFRPITHRNPDADPLQRLGVHSEYMLTCGSLLPYRRCEDVIDAFNQLGADDTELQLVIAGSGSDKRYADLLRGRMAESPYRDRILAVGHVSKDTMITLYGRAKLCVIATEIEACPNIAIEAMSSGCAIVSCDRSPLPEMFDDCSLEYSARDIHDLSRKMRLLLEDRSLRSDFGKRARERADNFSWAKCAQQTYSALVDWPES